MSHFLVLKDRHLKKTITNKLLNSKQATTPNNVNELPLFGLKFFLSLGAAQVFDTGRANYVPCSV